MKWSFEEDFIACKYYLSHVDTWRDHIDKLMYELDKAGFGNRKRGSVIMRLQNIEHLHTGNGLSNSAKQTQRIYTAFSQVLKNSTFQSGIQSFIKNNFDAGAISIDDALVSTPNNTTSYLPIGTVGPSFQKVLFSFIDASGMKDSEVYNSCFVGRDTFSHIRKGDRGVSKKTIKQLCFGLKLSYDDAVILMESAGYAFSNNSISDLVVVYFLKNRIYDIFAANAELYERNEELLFAA